MTPPFIKGRAGRDLRENFSTSRIVMESKNPKEELERIDLPITGMSCASCAAKIEKGLANVEGVSKATVNFAAEKATVVFHPDQTDLSHLIDKVKDLGYGAKSEKVSFAHSGNDLCLLCEQSREGSQLC